jgi:hypothetical protein
MINKKYQGPFLGVCYAIVFGSFAVIGIHDYWPDISIRAFLLLSGGAFIALYFAGRWVAVKSEMNRKLPTSSKELKRRTKEFYNWLASQGPPKPGR